MAMNHAEPSPVVPGVRPTGVPGWVHAHPHDAEAFRGFYSRLFGWQWDTVAGSVPGEQRFVAFSSRRPVASLSSGPQAPVASVGAAPARWSVCFISNDVRVTAQRILAAGGSTVCQDSVTQDPTKLVAVEARDPEGGAFVVLNEASIPQPPAPAGPATVTWAELITSEVSTSAEFYERIFDLGDMGLDDADPGYKTLTKDDQSWAGVVAGHQRLGEHANPDVPQWLPWFGVVDLTQTVELAKTLGATVVVEPIEMIPGLGICVMAGVEGELFTLHEEDFGPGPDATAVTIEH